MTKLPTRLEISAGGVAFRIRNDVVEVALISVGEENRWQLPKGIVDKNETTEAAAVREVREEAGVETKLAGRIDKVEYWYFARHGADRARIHKFVHFYLLEYCSGDVRDHDSEVNEARWVEIEPAIAMLAFEGERKILEKAKEMIEAAET